MNETKKLNTHSQKKKRKVRIFVIKIRKKTDEFIYTKKKNFFDFSSFLKH